VNQPTQTTISKAEARADRAMVATKDPFATIAGLEVLRAGGNAIDAAIAACFATGVVEPNSATLGGGGYIVYQMGDKGGVIGGHMPASQSARPDMFKLTGKAATGRLPSINCAPASRPSARRFLTLRWATMTESSPNAALPPA